MVDFIFGYHIFLRIRLSAYKSTPSPQYCSAIFLQCSSAQAYRLNNWRRVPADCSAIPTLLRYSVWWCHWCDQWQHFFFAKIWLPWQHSLIFRCHKCLGWICTLRKTPFIGSGNHLVDILSGLYKTLTLPSKCVMYATKLYIYFRTYFFRACDFTNLKQQKST